MMSMKMLGEPRNSAQVSVSFKINTCRANSYLKYVSARVKLGFSVGYMGSDKTVETG